ncbi:MAG: crossover junction endodeoxyribonuclease RuvC [Thermomicrobiales bacterium]|nr:crossover junction endodeoxyribonuclease RuvC [Thermomicrobiales bacterium]MCO5217304.1 crossover junction endodeoxyribonuclease RuvC [Thermomicrobiales bacterium]MCO5226332.1 crossover junction endodeoxyribonuclease RuvC [Thermomicrobiales bacterium]MCO5228734.1 crossover junction endodeoxyribonuclease RuvC [Thermomicrobiales bacterium]
MQHHGVTLGIDPGTARLGYGVIAGGMQPQLVDAGLIETWPDEPMSARLVTLYEGVVELIEEFHPDALAIEQLFFARNVTTAITVGQARGVVLLAAAQANVPIAEYTPSEIKYAIAGYGKADKPQMQEMVRMILNLKSVPQPDDVADALAIAICHNQTVPFAERSTQ